MLTVEGGLGKWLGHGRVSVGVSYFAQWKLTDDEFGAITPPDAVGRHRVFGAGPEITILIFATDKAEGVLNARYLTEFVAESMTKGDTFIFSLTVEF